MGISSASAQGYLHDTANFKPSAARQFYENRGQLVTNLGDSIPQIKYYTEHGFEKMYFGTDGVHFAYAKFARRPDSAFSAADSLNLLDSFYRLDMSFACDPELYASCGTLTASDTGADQLNYYLPNCPNGIEHIKGYKIVTYANAFPGINVHFTSNPNQILSYFELTPNSNPGDIRLHFSGQDSLAINGSGNLIAYAQNNSTLVEHMQAYTFDAAGNVTQMSWVPQFQIDPNGDVSFLLGSYNASETLILRTVDEHFPLFEDEASDRWATYYDDAGAARGAVIKTEVLGYTESGGLVEDNMRIYTGQMEYAATFPAYNGVSVVGANIGMKQMYLSCFDGYNQRQWASYYGGPGWANNYITGMSIAANGVYLTGHCLQAPAANLFNGKFVNNNGDGWIGQFEKIHGRAIWTTQIAGSAAWVSNTPNCIKTTGLDCYGDYLYVVGNATVPVLTDNWSTTYTNGIGRFPMVKSGSSYFWPTNPGVDNGSGSFIMKFDMNTKELLWSTFIGNGLTLYAVKKTETGIFIGGATQSLNQTNVSISSPKTTAVNNYAPLVKPNNTAYFSDIRTCVGPTSGSCTYDGYIGMFDANNQLEWATYFGGNGQDVVAALDANAKNECWIVGSTNTQITTSGAYPTSSLLASGQFPCYKGALSGHGFNAAYNGGPTDDFVARFGTHHQLKWSTLFGGPGEEGDPQFVSHGGSAIYGTNNSYVSDYLPYTSIAIDQHSNAIIGGSTRKPSAAFSSSTIPVFPVSPFTNMWQQTLNASAAENLQGSDAYYALFNDNNDIVWSQHFGGNGINSIDPNSYYRADERCEGIALFEGKRIYTILTSFSQRTPVNCPIIPTKTPYCDLFYHGNGDVVLGFFPYNNIYGTTPAGVEALNPTTSSALQLQAMPNPVKHTMTASFMLQQNELISLDVVNTLGQTIIHESFAAHAGANYVRYNTNYLASGMYYLTLKTATKHESTKFIKE